MSNTDREHWDARYAAVEAAADAALRLPRVFAACEPRFPARGHALELACGSGSAAVWLAQRGLDVLAVDVSPIAIRRAEARRARSGCAARLRFAVFDLDDGLPDGPVADLILCCNFRAPRLYAAMVARLAPGGILAIATLSEVGAQPGRFRARPGELRDAFAALQPLAGGEGDGAAWFVGRAASPVAAPCD